MVSSFQLPKKKNRCSTSGGDFSTEGGIVNMSSPVAAAAAKEDGTASMGHQTGYNRLAHKNWRQHRSMQIDDQIQQMIRKKNNASSAFT